MATNDINRYIDRINKNIDKLADRAADSDKELERIRRILEKIYTVFINHCAGDDAQDQKS